MSPCLPADWPAPANVHAFTTLRHGAGASPPPFDSFNLGNCSNDDGDDPEIVESNRADLARRFSLPSSPRWLRQVHGTQVLRFGHASIAGEAPAPEADAAVTGEAGVVLAILTADCLPVVLAANDGSEVAAAHAGWRGLAAGVLENTLSEMRAPPGRVLAWLGPAAGSQAYEVGVEVRDAFVDRDPRTATAFQPTRPGHWHADLYALARQRLVDAGVTCIHGGGECTITDADRFFSHRRDQRSGRIATLAWLDA